MMEQLVSAIITTHNRKELLNRAIQSVEQQTYKRIELIVVDDASTDGTDVVCENRPFTYIRISQQESKGGNYARNVGIKAAKGEYCAFLDDDDYWMPDKIEKQVNLINQMDCELVHCGRRLENVKDGQLSYQDKNPRQSHYGDMRKKIFLTICTTTSSCILCKRSALLDIGLFDENINYWQDYELTIRLAQRKPFYFVNEPLTVYRVDVKDKGRLTNKYFAWKKSVAYIYEKHRELYKKLNVFEKLGVTMLYCNDARRRCLASKLYIRAFFFFIVCSPVLFLLGVKKVTKSEF